MNDKSSAELEREAEAVRERVAGTAESIRKKLSAGQLIDEFADMFTGGDFSETLRNLKSQVRDNPIPLALVGAGIAWLAFGKGISSQKSYASYGQSAPRAASRKTTNAGQESMMSSVAESAKSAAESVAGTVSGVAESVTNTVSGVADSLSGTADRLRHSMLTGTTHGARNLQSSFSGAMDQQPLLIAGLGLTVGAVVGAMLPASDIEKDLVGSGADRIRQTARQAVDRGMDSASRVASQAYDALKEEADRQGLVPGEGPSVGERVSKVVRSAAQSAEEAVREEMGVKTDDGQQRTSSFDQE